MHHQKRGRTPWSALYLRLRAERGAPLVTRRRRPAFGDRALALTVYVFIAAFAVAVTSLAVGLVASA